jgi:uncharacterized membrane protein YsdA (DUF1294 family)/cold shock CspA family protein
MRHVGRLTDWNDAKGFGFVTPYGGGARAFVHIKAFEKRGLRPVEGELISYEPVFDARRRLNATRVRSAEPGKAGIRRSPWFPRRTAGILALLAFAGAAYLHRVPPLVPVIYIGMSVVAFLAYGLDKSAARSNRWRTQESSLHLLELLCGWPGALIAQGSFRHKTRKTSFQVAFWLVVALNLGGLAWLIHSGGIELLQWPLRGF